MPPRVTPANAVEPPAIQDQQELEQEIAALTPCSGVVGEQKCPGGAGVVGFDYESADGVVGITSEGSGVRGNSQTGFGLLGQSGSSSGLVATSATGQGVTAFSDNDVALFAQGGTFGGVFNGTVVVNKGPGRKDGWRPPRGGPRTAASLSTTGTCF